MNPFVIIGTQRTRSTMIEKILHRHPDIDCRGKEAGKSWEEIFYYFVLDIPSMAWGLGVTYNQIMDYYKIKGEPQIHAGNTGALLNVRVYKGILRYRKEISK